jgi:hypothetical protein
VIIADRIGHPVFGCSRKDKVTSVSLHALCRELLPGGAERDSAKKEKHVSYSADIDEQSQPGAKSWYEMAEGGMAGAGNEHLTMTEQHLLATVAFGQSVILFSSANYSTIHFQVMFLQVYRQSALFCTHFETDMRWVDIFARSMCVIT